MQSVHLHFARVRHQRVSQIYEQQKCQSEGACDFFFFKVQNDLWDLKSSTCEGDDPCASQ